MSVAILAYCTVFFSACEGLDVPLHQYSVSEWNLSGLDLLQLTSRDLEKLGVHKIGHQELILEAVEKLCSLVSLCVRTSMMFTLSHEVDFTVSDFTVWHLYTNSDSRQNQNIQQLQPVLYKSYLDCSKINNSWVHCLYSACMFILKCFCNLILVIRFLFIKEMMVWMCFCCNQISTVTMQSLQPSAINTPLLWSVIFFFHPVCRPLIKSSSLSSFREGV